jgi:hypothetical protein
MKVIIVGPFLTKDVVIHIGAVIKCGEFAVVWVVWTGNRAL